ncbi:unnamed protein product [Amoebophrya sp. A120]|nr:unnamed protein product [Amoebophrya sp. A120]|eukprot:GSA120T00001334001.1
MSASPDAESSSSTARAGGFSRPPPPPPSLPLVPEHSEAEQLVQTEQSLVGPVGERFLDALADYVFGPSTSTSLQLRSAPVTPQHRNPSGAPAFLQDCSFSSRNAAAGVGPSFSAQKSRSSTTSSTSRASSAIIDIDRQPSFGEVLNCKWTATIPNGRSSTLGARHDLGASANATDTTPRVFAAEPPSQAPSCVLDDDDIVTLVEAEVQTEEEFLPRVETPQPQEQVDHKELQAVIAPPTTVEAHSQCDSVQSHSAETQCSRPEVIDSSTQCRRVEHVAAEIQCALRAEQCDVGTQKCAVPPPEQADAALQCTILQAPQTDAETQCTRTGHRDAATQSSMQGECAEASVQCDFVRVKQCSDAEVQWGPDVAVSSDVETQCDAYETQQTSDVETQCAIKTLQCDAQVQSEEEKVACLDAASQYNEGVAVEMGMEDEKDAARNAQCSVLHHLVIDIEPQEEHGVFLEETAQVPVHRRHDVLSSAGDDDRALSSSKQDVVPHELLGQLEAEKRKLEIAEETVRKLMRKLNRGKRKTRDSASFPAASSEQSWTADILLTEEDLRSPEDENHNMSDENEDVRHLGSEDRNYKKGDRAQLLADEADNKNIDVEPETDEDFDCSEEVVSTEVERHTKWLERVRELQKERDKEIINMKLEQERLLLEREEVEAANTKTIVGLRAELATLQAQLVQLQQVKTPSSSGAQVGLHKGKLEDSANLGTDVGSSNSASPAEGDSISTDEIRPGHWILH